MIITSQKTPAKILELLAGHEKVFLVGCAVCATTCRTGGEDQVKEMAEFLKKSGKIVVGSVVIESPCDRRAVKKDLENNPELKEAEAVLVLACGSGAQVVAEIVKQRILPGLDTKSLGRINSLRDIQAACGLCGNCQVDILTAKFCPQNSCPKRLVNGPCGGVREGKYCEVYPDQDCVWVKIYDELVRTKRLDVLFKIVAAKDISGQVFSQSRSQ